MRITLSIPNELAERAVEHMGDRSIQAFTLDALRDKVYGSAIERELRRQLAELLDRLGQTTTTTRAPEPGITPMLEELLTVQPVEKLGW